MRKFFLFLLLTSFILLTTAGGVLIILKNSLLDLQYYADEFRNSGIIELGYEEAFTALKQEQEEFKLEDSPLLFSNDEIESLVYEAFPTSWFYDQIDRAVSDLSSWLDSDEPEFDIVVDISSQRDTFAELVKSTLERKQAALPFCTMSELIRMQETGKVTFDCVPEGMSLEQFLGPEGYGFLDNFTQVLPDKISLKKIIDGTIMEDFNVPEGKIPEVKTGSSDTKAYQELVTGLQDVRSVYGYVSVGERIWLIIVIGLLSLMLAITLHSLPALLRWIGTSLFLLGLNFLGMRLALQWLHTTVSDTLIQELTSDTPTEVLEYLITIINTIFNRVEQATQPWMLIPLLIGASCYAGLILYWIIRKYQAAHQPV
ncbi:MAG TPA: hypothetical protein PKL83_00835 [bacterium]|nr:hypothetical protein [bacterium]